MKFIKLTMIGCFFVSMVSISVQASFVENMPQQVGIDRSVSLQESQQKFAQDVVLLLTHMLHQGYKFTFGETMRTKEQAELYAKQGKGIKNSLHCKRLAIDINLFNPQGEFLSKSEDHTLFGEYWESLSPVNRWCGKFTRPDGDHYERNETFE
jgi:hypothetical protein